MERNTKHSLTKYQRGNRDGLLSLAAELDLQVDDLITEINRWKEHARNRHGNSMGEMITHLTSTKNQIILLAALVRRRSEALPEDPENEEY
jgi:hypothetical protein